MGDAQVPYRDRILWWILARMERGGTEAPPDSSMGEQPLAQPFCRHENLVSAFGGCALAWQTLGWRLDAAGGLEKGCFCHSY